MKELSLEEAALAWAQKKNVEATDSSGTGDFYSIAKPGSKNGRWNPLVFIGDGNNRFRLAPEPPAIGSAAWANSLPEGTKVRYNAAGWTADKFTAKRNGAWSKWGAFSWTPDDGPETGWELYTEPPAKKWRPWTPEEVPVGAQTKTEVCDSEIQMIVGRNLLGVLLAQDNGAYPFRDMLELRLHSLDNGKTWLPCGVEVDA